IFFDVDAREVFCSYDTKGDEKICVGQVADVLRALGLNSTEAEIKKCCSHWNSLDTRITFEEFLPIYQTIVKTSENLSAEEFVDGLSHFDKEGNGFISVAELRHILTNLGEKLTDEEVDQLLQGQEDSNGNVNIADFVRPTVGFPWKSFVTLVSITENMPTHSPTDKAYKFIAAIVKSTDGVENYGEGVLEELLNFSYVYTIELLKDAVRYAEFAGRKAVIKEDLLLALEMRKQNANPEGFARQNLQLMKECNMTSLPLMSSAGRVRLHSERYDLVQPPYGLKPGIQHRVPVIAAHRPSSIRSSRLIKHLGIMSMSSHTPKATAIMIAIVKQIGGADDYDEGVINQLLNLSYGYTSEMLEDARKYAEFASRKTIDAEDIQLARQMRMQDPDFIPPSRELFLELAKERNNIALPILKAAGGLRLPADRYCLLQPNHNLKHGIQHVVPPAHSSSSSISGVKYAFIFSVEPRLMCIIFVMGNG
ncbi:unnamed protein product, partial [Soboliphyme baturini]|uniref:EF-hand domain-containing protein n=1 Tax=Soboliphyme baturini TaxID=241478 RepID=A0A183J5V8_9BILA